MKKPHLLVLATILIAVTGTALAQQPVYLCNDTYTDRPCANRKEVDILPTEGMRSLSGQKKQSQDAVMRDVSRQMQQAQKRGIEQGVALHRCAQIREERIQLDQTNMVGTLTDRRLAIRQEQFKLGCKQN